MNKIILHLKYITHFKCSNIPFTPYVLLRSTQERLYCRDILEKYSTPPT